MRKRSSLYTSLLLAMVLAVLILPGQEKDLHTVQDGDFPYSDFVPKALEELRKRGGPWKVEPGRISLLKVAADVYGAPPQVLQVQPGGGVSVDRTGMRLRRLEPGEFTMGSPSDESRRRPNEPLRKVRLTRPFSIGLTEVTNRQYIMVMGKSERFSKLMREDLEAPVLGVSWKEAMEFCGRLGAIEGRKYRLPTEAEWEYACRAGSRGPFSFEVSEDQLRKGPGLDVGEHLWYVGNNDLTKPKPVSLKKPNGWGLFDMHGNVEELCLDVLPDAAGAETLIDPRGPEEGEIQWCVVRGGRFRDQIHECRAARRRKELLRDANGFGVGFRVVREE